MDARKIEEYLLSGDKQKMEEAMEACIGIARWQYIRLTRLFSGPDRQLPLQEIADACDEALMVLVKKVRNGTLESYGGVGGLISTVAYRAAERRFQKLSRQRPLADDESPQDYVVVKDSVVRKELLDAILQIVASDLTAREQSAFNLFYADVWAPAADPNGEAMDHVAANGVHAETVHPSEADYKALSRGMKKVRQGLHARGLTDE